MQDLNVNNMKRFVFAALVLVAVVPVLNAQAEKPYEFNIEGQIVAVTDGKGIFLNAGGPGLKFHFRHFAVSVNMMPSLRFQKEDLKPLVTPMLGCGPQLYFLKERRLVFSFPCYYNQTSRVWSFTAGVGYVFSGKKWTKKNDKPD